LEGYFYWALVDYWIGRTKLNISNVEMCTAKRRIKTEEVKYPYIVLGINFITLKPSQSLTQKVTYTNKIVESTNSINDLSF
jgi:hypothetical protein